MKTSLLFVTSWCVLGLLSACTADEADAPRDEQLSTVRVLTPEQVNYVPLNPARGDRSPKAGVLWGDIRSDRSSGVLLQFADGFSSPPHIHNITYRAVVISGELHNDDPGAEMFWMGPGAFWTQPAGENHITAARPGSGATAFLEILSGPYLVQPATEAFDNGERPVNVASSNLVWMGAEEFSWVAKKSGNTSAEVALLWGELSGESFNGSFVRMSSGFSGSVSTISGLLRSVVVQGELAHSVSNATETTVIGAGGFFESAHGLDHSVSCQSDSPCVIYLRTRGEFRVQ